MSHRSNSRTRLLRKSSWGETGEHRHLQSAEYTAGDDGILSPSNLSEVIVTLPVYTNILRIRRLVIARIDDAYTDQQLREPQLNALVVRPLVDRLYDADDISLVYALFANRIQFLREQTSTGQQTVNKARAALCELIADRILRRFHEDNPGSFGLLLLTKILVEGLDPFQGAPEEVERTGRALQWPVQHRGGPREDRKLTTLELAIVSNSKTFISSSACQRVVTAIHQGTIVYTSLSFVDILPDHYNHQPISIYDPHRAPILNHSRLIVPRVRSGLEFVHFFLLLATYLLLMANLQSRHRQIYETAFAAYAGSWILDEFAAIIEHGWEVHSQNLWSFLDMTFTLLYGFYVGIRIHSLIVGSGGGGGDTGNLAMAVLIVAAPVLLARTAFSAMPYNIVFICLHAIMRDFAVLTILATWCFAGFLLALYWLSQINPLASGEHFGYATIAKWLLWLWFGLDGTGIEQSPNFHGFLGPTLVVAFVFLGNTLFLTVLVAMLTNKFSNIIADQNAEILFRQTVLTFAGVKSDSLFAYPPPFNVLALALLTPLRYLIHPLKFHQINVRCIQFINAPTLLLIGLYDRYWKHQQGQKGSKRSYLDWRFTGFSPHGDIQAVFRATPPKHVQDMLDEMDDLDDVEEDALENALHRKTSRGTSRAAIHRRRLSNGSGAFMLPSARP